MAVTHVVVFVGVTEINSLLKKTWSDISFSVFCSYKLKLIALMHVKFCFYVLDFTSGNIAAELVYTGKIYCMINVNELLTNHIIMLTPVIYYA